MNIDVGHTPTCLNGTAMTGLDQDLPAYLGGDGRTVLHLLRTSNMK